MKKFEVPWDADPHTKVKHDLYRRYLAKWTPIMVQGAWRGRATYAEGFAGPGVYLDGAPGSPVIALKAIVDNPRIRTRRNKNLRLLLVDRDERCVSMLRDEMTKAAAPVPLDVLPTHGITVVIEKGTCVPTLPGLLDEHRSWGEPILAVLDTWGASVPLDLVRRIAANPSSEVIITIQPQFFTRFAEATDLTYGDRVFGSTRWREVANQSPEFKAKWLIENYRDAIRDAGFTHVLDFELVDADSRSLYLVFGTSHDLGLQKMKEAMWEVDVASGTGYRDPRDPAQEALDIAFEPQTRPLQRILRNHVSTLPGHRASVEDLRQFAFRTTVYKSSQVPGAVEEMVNRGELELIERGLSRFSRTVGIPEDSSNTRHSGSSGEQ